MHDIPSQLAWIAVWGGAAYLPDLDGPSATAAHAWGPITGYFARAVGFLAGGHRNRTHDIVLAPVVFGAATWLASMNQWSSLAVVALALGLAVEAVGRFLPGDWKSPGLNFLFSVTASYSLIHGGYDWSWLPYAAAGGVIVHIFGDSITIAGVPVPLSTFDKRRQTWGLRLFEAGKMKVEQPITITCLILCVAGGTWFTVGQSLVNWIGSYTAGA